MRPQNRNYFTATSLEKGSLVQLESYSLTFKCGLEGRRGGRRRRGRGGAARIRRGAHDGTKTDNHSRAQCAH